MIINNDSPLRRLPPLDPKTTLILDGIRYSIEMADAAYSKLHKTIFNKMCSIRLRKYLIPQKNKLNLKQNTLIMYRFFWMLGQWLIRYIDCVGCLNAHLLLCKIQDVNSSIKIQMIFNC